MKIIKMPLSSLKKPDRNVRIHTEKQLREFERSITMFGQIRPLVVDETCTILAGVGCYETLVRMGRETADVYQMTNLSESQKKKLMIADNKLFGLGIDDIDTFNQFLEELQGDLDIPGFDEDILKSMVAVAEEVSETLSTYGTIDSDEVATIKAAAEKKEAMMAQATQPTPAPMDNPPVSTQPMAPVDTTKETPTEPAETHKYVLCPHCGQKVWL